ncbi:MAG: HEPN domain-containing protein [Methanoregula sp.]|jgi:hypothetical protein|uniref:ApeA N-terminal domain 1-containing protein n=1 Tax=Methanoregula sp. TaxID=2052170 RepID=UPI003D0B62FD
MVEKFSEVGIWWLPENPEKKVHGTLSYSPETGAKLQVMGSLETLDNASTVREYDIINGFTGSEITLYKCFTQTAPYMIFNPEIITTEYFANVIFKGHTFKKGSDIKFKYARTGYNHLESWFFRNTMSFTSSKNGEFSVTTKSLDPITANIDDKLKISLISSNEHSGEWKIEGMKVTLQDKAFADIETSMDMNFEQFMNISSRFQRFLTIAINKPIWIQSLVILISEKGEADKPVEVFLEIQRHLLEKDKVIHPSMMPFSFDIISDKFERILKNWFEKSSLMDPVFNLYFALQYGDKMYIEHKFLNLISCLESYHRRRYNGQYLTNPNYDDFKQKITEFFPMIEDSNYADFKTKFINSLKYGNEPSLRKRLNFIFNDNRPITSKYIKNQDLFINKVLDTRNYRTHFDKELEKLAISDFREYNEYNLKLKLLVEVCIFKELGFNLTDIEAILARNQKYQHMLSQT